MDYKNHVCGKDCKINKHVCEGAWYRLVQEKEVLERAIEPYVTAIKGEFAKDALVGDTMINVARRLRDEKKCLEVGLEDGSV